MSRYTRKYHLPDRGFTVIRLAHDLEHGRGAMKIEPAIESMRRPNGAFTFTDVQQYRTITDGPLSVLRELLDLEALEIKTWAKEGFNRFHKRSNANYAEKLCRQQGSEAAVEWVITHATNPVDIDALRQALGQQLFQARGRDEDFYRNQIRSCL